MAPWDTFGRDRLSGNVEVDETLIGCVHAGKRGRGAVGNVFVAVEQTRPRASGILGFSLSPMLSEKL